ncbi:hypothetical protein XELAEV_18018911mg [Xenopus laevis]|uniref:Uncharacterized protein n=1 Tax=Xenopus laevis TaxID=8355 RepID=A0A974DE21_XENLA|nr:hypothetical protein XELAEV_18018911mg [Xenopus laevis]
MEPMPVQQPVSVFIYNLLSSFIVHSVSQMFEPNSKSDLSYLLVSDSTVASQLQQADEKKATLVSQITAINQTLGKQMPL